MNFAVCACNDFFWAYLIVSADNKEDAASKFRSYLSESEIPDDPGYTFKDEDIASSADEDIREWYRITHEGAESEEYPTVVILKAGPNG